MKRQVLLVRRSDLALVRRSDAPDGLVKGNLIKGLMLTSLHSDHLAGLAGLPDTGQNNFVVSTNSNNHSSPGPSSSTSSSPVTNVPTVQSSPLAVTATVVPAANSSSSLALAATSSSSTSSAASPTAATASYAVSSSSTSTTHAHVVLRNSASINNTNNNAVVNNSTANYSGDYPAHPSPTSSSISSASTVDQQEIRHAISPSLENIFVSDTAGSIEPEPLLVVDHHSRAKINNNSSGHQATAGVYVVDIDNSHQNNPNSTNIINNSSTNTNSSSNNIINYKNSINSNGSLTIKAASIASHDKANAPTANLNHTMLNLSSLHQINATSTSTSNSNNNSNASGSQAKRPRLTNSRATLTPWKALQYHFQRHADVKQRPDKKLTMSELSHEGLQRRNGWKVHHLVGQLDDLIDNEFQMRERLKTLLDSFQTSTSAIVHELAEKCKQDFVKMSNETLSTTTEHGNNFLNQLHRQRSYGRNEFDPSLIVTRLDDMLQGNVQRSSLFGDQLNDSRDLIVRITDEHKDRVARITSRSLNKRSYVRERQAS